jgi:hypothetical protein
VRILVAIPHYFDPGGGGPYSSRGPDAGPRVAALRACLAALHRLWGRPHALLDHARRQVVPLPGTGAALDVVLCTTRGRHLLDRLPAGLFRHRPTAAEPALLGFECHAALRDGLGNYAWFCYLEDDLVVHDPWLFRKVAWFGTLAGGDALLQPYRYEIGRLDAAVPRLYLDGDLPAHETARYQDVTDRPELTGEFLGRPVTFRRALNPHAGCFFLDADRMTRWAARPDFLDRDTGFIGPLESAATLGVMRTFRVYKPAPHDAAFLEIQHGDTKHLDAVGGQLPLAPEYPRPGQP